MANSYAHVGSDGSGTGRCLTAGADGRPARRPMAFDRRATLAGRRQQQSVLKKEIAFYRTIQGRYGLPLDNRAAYTRIDWPVWTVCLTGDRADFDALVA